MTGGSVADGIKFINALMGANAKQIAALDTQYHFLTASQLEHIQELDNEGNADQARAVAMSAASQAVRERANEVAQSVSIMSKAWEGLTGAVSGAWNAMKQNAGPQSASMQLSTAEKALAAAQGTHFNTAQQLVPNGSPDEIARLQAQVNTLKAQVVQQGFVQTQASVAAFGETRAKQGNAYLDQFKSPVQAFTDSLSKAANARQNALLAPNLTPDERSDIEAKYQSAAAVALQAYNNALSKGAHTAHGRTRKQAAPPTPIFDLSKQTGLIVTESAADRAYNEQLNQQLATRKAAIALQVESVGMGDKEVQRMQQLDQVYQQFNRQLAQLNRERDAGSISDAQYSNRLAMLRQNELATVSAMNNGFAQMDQAQSKWQNGFSSALANLQDQSANVAGQVNGLFTDAFSGLSNAIVNFVQTGKLSFKDLANSVISDLA